MFTGRKAKGETMSDTQSSITAKALLMRLRCSSFTNEIKDPIVTSDAQARASAAPRSGRYTKRLFPKAATRKLLGVIGAAKDAHAELTYPWWEGGVGLLPITMLDRYRKTVESFQDQLVAAKGEFRRAFESNLEYARTDLGDMFRPGDYPDVEAILSRYDIRFDAEPLPDGKNLHYMQHVAEEDIERMKAELERRIDSQIEVAESRKVAEIVEALKAAAEMMGDTDEGKPRRFYRSVVERLRTKAGLLADLNVGASEKVREVAEQVSKAASFSDDKVRPSSKGYDASVRNRAQHDLERMAALFGDADQS